MFDQCLDLSSFKECQALSGRQLCYWQFIMILLSLVFKLRYSRSIVDFPQCLFSPNIRYALSWVFTEFPGYSTSWLSLPVWNSNVSYPCVNSEFFSLQHPGSFPLACVISPYVCMWLSIQQRTLWYHYCRFLKVFSCMSPSSPVPCPTNSTHFSFP